MKPASDRSPGGPGHQGPLRGYRVIDLSVFAQGGVAGGLLRELGAEVIKVERPGGDPGRRLGVLPQGVSTFYEPMNRGKWSVVLDLTRPEGRDVVLRLAEQADVFLQNGRPGSLERLGLGYEDVSRVNPAIIYAHGTGYGLEGPDAEQGVVDIVGQARSGLAAVTGSEAPTPAGAILSDHLGAVYLAVGVLGALVHRERTGEGQSVECSMLGAMIAAQQWELSHYLFTDEVPRRSGRGHQLFFSLWGIYDTANGFVALAGVPEPAWRGFVQAVGAPHLLDDPRFATQDARRANSDALAGEVAEALRHVRTEDVLRVGQAMGIRCTAVQDYAALAADPQVAANAYMREVEHPVLGRVRITGNPIRYSGTPLDAPVAARALGADTDRTLADLGYSDHERDDLRTRGVMG